MAPSVHKFGESPCGLRTRRLAPSIPSPRLPLYPSQVRRIGRPEKDNECALSYSSRRERRKEAESVNTVAGKEFGKAARCAPRFSLWEQCWPDQSTSPRVEDRAGSLESQEQRENQSVRRGVAHSEALFVADPSAWSWDRSGRPREKETSSGSAPRCGSALHRRAASSIGGEHFPLSKPRLPLLPTVRRRPIRIGVVGCYVRKKKPYRPLIPLWTARFIQ
jgi:hypothetical protein